MLLAEMLGEVIGITSNESTVIDFGVKLARIRPAGRLPSTFGRAPSTGHLIQLRQLFCGLRAVERKCRKDRFRPTEDFKGPLKEPSHLIHGGLRRLLQKDRDGQYQHCDNKDDQPAA